MKTKYKIYVVDDNAFNLMMVSTRLRRIFKCEVKEFQTAESCIGAMEGELPDLIVTDFRLHPHNEHGMNGNEMMQHIKNDYPDIPVIIYSHVHSLELAVEMMREGADDFIPRDKHFLNRIADTVRYHLDRMKTKYEIIWGKRLIIFLILLFSGTLFFLYHTNEQVLKYFIFSFAVIIGVIVFFSDRITGKKKQIQ
ncbi:MAG: response regulator [Bacteroidota bacterium]